MRDAVDSEYYLLKWYCQYYMIIPVLITEESRQAQGDKYCTSYIYALKRTRSLHSRIHRGRAKHTRINQADIRLPVLC